MQFYALDLTGASKMIDTSKGISWAVWHYSGEAVGIALNSTSDLIRWEQTHPLSQQIFEGIRWAIN